MTESVPFLGAPINTDQTYNLTIVRNRQRVLFGTKTRGFGTGKLVLPGGKDQHYLNSSGVWLLPATDNAASEANQETGITLARETIHGIGLLLVQAEDEQRAVRLFEAHVDDTTAASTEPSDELDTLHWIPENAVPYTDTPEDYKLWLPHVLTGYAVSCFITSSNNRVVGSTIYRQQIEPLGRIELAKE